MIVEQLREATRPIHAELDHGIFPVIQSIKTHGQYARFLKTFYGFFKPVYDQLDIYIDRMMLPDYDLRRKPALILEDLRNIGLPDDEPEVCKNIPLISNRSGAFGAMYVLEGSTMGGGIISKRIRENLDLQNNNGLAFFSAYGERNPQMWGIFLKSLDNPDHLIAADALVDTATLTFKSFHDWIALHYPVRLTHKEAI